MAAKTCPRCHLISEPEADQCDCGYEFATGVVGSQRAARQMSKEQREAVGETARAYRALVGLAVGQAVVGGGSRGLAHFAKAQGDAQAVLVLSAISMLALAVLGLAAATASHRAAKGMGLRSPAGWAVAVFFGGILAVLLMNREAREWCARHDLRFGIVGPHLADVERFRCGGK